MKFRALKNFDHYKLDKVKQSKIKGGGGVECCDPPPDPPKGEQATVVYFAQPITGDKTGG